MSSSTITGQIRKIALQILENNPQRVRYSELSRKILDLTNKGAEKKSIMKDWNEFLEHYQGDQIVDSKKSKFFEQEGQSDMPEKKKYLKIL
jgi:hypothetical protein